MKKLLALVLCLMLLACSAIADEPAAPRMGKFSVSDPVLSFDGQELLNLEGLSFDLFYGYVDGSTPLRALLSIGGDAILDATMTQTDGTLLYHLEGMTNDYFMEAAPSVDADIAGMLLDIFQDFNPQDYVTSTYEETEEGVTYACTDFLVDPDSFDKLLMQILDSLTVVYGDTVEDMRRNYEINNVRSTISGTSRVSDNGGNVYAEWLLEEEDDEDKTMTLEWGWLRDGSSLTAFTGSVAIDNAELISMQYAVDGDLYQGKLSMAGDIDEAVDIAFSVDRSARDAQINIATNGANLLIDINWDEDGFDAVLAGTDERTTLDATLSYHDGVAVLDITSAGSTLTLSCNIEFSEIEGDSWMPVFSDNQVDLSTITEAEETLAEQEIGSITGAAISRLFTEYPMLSYFAQGFSAGFAAEMDNDL